MFCEMFSQHFDMNDIVYNQDSKRPLYKISQTCVFTSLASGRCVCNIQLVIPKLISNIYDLSISCEINLKWKPQYFSDD